MTPDEFALAVAYMRRLWPQQRFPQRTADAWWRLLGDIEADSLIAAVEDLATEGREFPPSAGQLRKRACELASPPIPDPDEAWQEVLREMASVGSYGTPTWSHPAIAGAVEAIGWRSLCLSENTVADRAHFLGFYGTVRSRQERLMAMSPKVRQLVSGLADKLALNRGEPGS